jgi:hypothetical protein
MSELDLRDYQDVSEQPPIEKSPKAPTVIDAEARTQAFLDLMNAELEDALTELNPAEKIAALKRLASSLVERRHDTLTEANICAVMYEVLCSRGEVAPAIQDIRDALSRLD